MKTKNATLSLPIDDNRLLQRVAGVGNAHIAAIESALDVLIQPTDDGLSISGGKVAAEAARNILKTIINRALVDKRAEIDSGFVQGLLSHTGSGPREAIVTRKRTIEARNPAQSAYIKMLQDKDLVFGVGPAGTGKTYLAVVYAAQLLETGVVERIILCRPAVEAGERLGFLPGDMKEKVDPYLRPLYDALHDVMTPDMVERHIEQQTIEIAPLAFMRGRTLAHAAIILDEAQNATREQMKMFLTRIGEGSKMIVTGDPSQIDLPPHQHSGLVDALGILSGEPDIGIIKFTGSDVVRRALVGKIVNAYDKHATLYKSGG